MVSYYRQGLYTALNESKDVGNFFGICYSILTWSGVGKGLSYNPVTWKNSAFKLLESGHVSTFLLTPNHLVTTGISDNSWVFNDGGKWGRSTGSSTTYVYYKQVNDTFLTKYDTIRKELEGTKTAYAMLRPNILSGDTNYQNCNSSSHYLMYRLGLGKWISSKGWWIPTVSNWSEWFASFITSEPGWKYKVLQSTNTHLG